MKVAEESMSGLTEAVVSDNAPVKDNAPANHAETVTGNAPAAGEALASESAKAASHEPPRTLPGPASWAIAVILAASVCIYIALNWAAVAIPLHDLIEALSK